MTRRAISQILMIVMTGLCTLPANAATPHGVNLLADPSFEASLETSPWQAASGSQDTMLCPDEHCGDCYRRSGSGALRFEARDTDDVWAIQQTVNVPVTDTYEVSFYFAGCNGAPSGTLSIALGDFPPQTLQLDPAEETGAYRYRSFVFSSIPEGEGIVKAEGSETIPMTLTIGNPALGEADVSIDDIRLVARGAGEACAPALEDPLTLNPWVRTHCNEITTSTWRFNEDNTFSLVLQHDENEGWAEYYYGTWCRVSDEAIEMLVTSRCNSSDEVIIAEGESSCGWEPGQDCFIERCTEEEVNWYGLMSLDLTKTADPLLTLRVHRRNDCPISNLDGAPVYGFPATNDPACETNALEPCLLPTEGEATEEGEGESCTSYLETDTDLSGASWDYYSRVNYHLNFLNNSVSLDVDSGEPYETLKGTYSVDKSVNPHRISILFTQLEFLEFGEGMESGEYEWIRIEVHECLTGVYWVCDDLLHLRMLDPLSGWDEQLNGIFVRDFTNPTSFDCPDTEETDPSTGTSAMAFFMGIDFNNDLQLSMEESGLGGMSPSTFAQLDINSDGSLTPAELFQAAGPDAPRHSADTNLDGAFSLAELLRSIQMYNAGGYSCAPQADSEDGYLPQPFEGKGADPGCPAHASDYAPADGVISLSELLRAIQLFNTGPYLRCVEGGEDGFCSAD